MAFDVRLYQNIHISKNGIDKIVSKMETVKKRGKTLALIVNVLVCVGEICYRVTEK